MKVDVNTQAEVNETVERCIDIVKDKWGSKVAGRMPEIKYSLKGTVAGYAHTRKNIIELHPVFLNKYKDAYISQTVVHEYAHLAAYRLNPKGASHGDTFMSMMRLLGAREDKYHYYLKEGITHEWKCDHGVVMILGPVQQKKALKHLDAQKVRSLYNRRECNCGTYRPV